MDLSPKSISGRRRSSVFNDGLPSPSTTTAPRKASIFDSLPEPPIASPIASEISSRRRSTVTSDGSLGPASGYSDGDAGSVVGRKASVFDEQPVVTAGVQRASVSDVAGRRATALDRPPWDIFAGAPPAYENSTWGWMSDIMAITSSSTTPRDRNRVFYAGNVNYIFEINEKQNLAIADIGSIMYAYGLEKSITEEILSKLDPQKSGMFITDPQNKQILLDSTMNFSPPKEHLSNLRHASKCFEKGLLSPLHFAGYIISILKGKHLEIEPPFMILGIYGIFGVMGGLTTRNSGMLTTKDVETFTKMWKVLNTDEVQDLLNIVSDDHNGSISCWALYNLLYRRNVFGKQRIQAFDIRAQQNPSLFFPILDKDKDGYLSSEDIRSFAVIFGKKLTNNEAIDKAIQKFDMDGDGKISFEDFHKMMTPILDGMTWEFWLVAILLTLDL